MTSGIAALDELNLETLDPQGRPPKPSRLPNATAVRGLYQSHIRDDEQRSIARARTQAMKDGEPPYNHAALTAAGQGSRANANFLEGQKLIQTTCNGYHDLVTSQARLVDVVTEWGEPQQRDSINRIIGEECTRTLKKWGGFMQRYMRLVDLFVTHGVGFAYFPDTRGFKFEVAGLADFQFPQQTPACDEDIPYVIARKDYQPTELYEKIRNTDAAATEGWNVNAVRAAIGRATTQGSIGEIGEYEQWQSQVKNSDLYTARKFAHIPCLHCWIQEFDGTVSYAVTEKDGDGEFLLFVPSKYESIEQALVSFCYGVGNGTFHSIRGMGHMIYTLVQLRNRLLCQTIDATMAGISIPLECDSDKDRMEASIDMMGGFLFLPRNTRMAENRAAANVSQVAQPILNEVKAMMWDNADRFNPRMGSDVGVYQNRDTVNAELEVAAGDNGALDLFYLSCDRLIREVTRRMLAKDAPKDDRLVRELHSRLKKRGITPEMIEEIDHAATTMKRAIGGGRPAARLSAYNRLIQLLPNLNEYGQKWLIHQLVADAIGEDNADFVAPEPEDDTPTSQAKVADMENMLLLMGNPIEVFPDEFHATHVERHIPKLMELLDQIERGQADPMQLLPGLQASLDHIGSHGEALAQDPANRVIYGQVKEAVNNIKYVVTNMERKIRAEERKLAEAGQPVDGQTPDPAAVEAEAKARITQIKLMTEELKFDLAQRKGELELASAQAKQQQALALNDLRQADQLMKKMAFPSTSYADRRAR